ncbi:MAG: hypothetical protein AB7L13_19995 [Acidimicrobiia bacterium]
MHPIERLRYVARASGIDQAVVVRETAAAIASMGRFDEQAIVTSCRRIIERHPRSGALWWMCSRVLTASDPSNEAWRCVEEISDDRTSIELAYALPDEATVCVLGWPNLVGEALARRGDLEVLVVDTLGEGNGLVRRLARSQVEAIEVPVSGLGSAVAVSDVVLLEGAAIGAGGYIGVAGSRAASSVAMYGEIPVWLVGGVGRVLPERMWDALIGRLEIDDEPWEADDEIAPIELVSHVVGPDGVEPVDEALAKTDIPLAPELFKRTDH